MSKRTVEVIGAGLSGLVAANRFAQMGWKVRIHERNPDLRMFGAGIWLWESGLKTLETIGAFDTAVKRARSIKEWQIRDHKGRILMSRTTTADDRLLLPPRADLYQALIDQAVANDVEIVTSSLAISATPDGRIQFENGPDAKADLVIVADGAYSRVRESILSTRWMDFGMEAGIRMLIDARPGDGTDTLVEHWNGSWRLLFNPCTEGKNYIFLSAPVDDTRARKIPIDINLWKTKFPQASDLLDRCEVDSRWDRLVSVRCRKWSEGRVAIIGDAAHAMPPNLGQAANTAFINVMALVNIVTSAQDIPNALEAWELEQRSISNHVQNWSYLYGYVLGKWPDSLLSLRSDFVSALSKTEWFDESLNRGARHVPMGYKKHVAELPSQNN